ncbi:MAG: cache domain-containing protein [Desulfobacteraceae bacterium]|nr:cache domain-containing protein [Desulfobacteraceae bacterium]
MAAQKAKMAVEWVARAKAFCASAGKEIALAEFTNPKGQFVKNELYIYVLDSNGFMLAHGMNPWFNGKNFLEVKDSEGKSFVREIVGRAKKEASGWVDYKWFDSATQKELSKSVYFELFEDMILCCGVYNQSPGLRNQKKQDNP